VKNKLREKLEIQILCPEGTTKTHTHTQTSSCKTHWCNALPTKNKE